MCARNDAAARVGGADIIALVSGAEFALLTMETRGGATGQFVACAENPPWTWIREQTTPIRSRLHLAMRKRDALKQLAPPIARTDLGASRGTSWRRFSDSSGAE